MDFNKEKPKKPISDAELIELRTDVLLGDLRKIGQDVKDEFEKKRAVEVMKRKRLEEGLDMPAELKPEPKLEMPEKKEEKREGGGMFKKEEMHQLPKIELENKARQLIEMTNELKAEKIREMEMLATGSPQVGVYQKQIEELDTSIKAAEEVLEKLREIKMGAFLDAVAADVDRKKDEK